MKNKSDTSISPLFRRCSVRWCSVKQAPDWLRRGLFCSGWAVIFLSKQQMDHVYYVAAPAQKTLPAFRIDGRHGEKKKQQLRSRCTCCVIWHTRTVPGEIPPCHGLLAQSWPLHTRLRPTSSSPFLLLFAKYPEFLSALHICVRLKAPLPLPLP